MLYSKSPYVSNLVSLLSEGCFINVDIVNSILTTFNFGRFQFWQFNNLAIFNFDNFQFWQLSILATFNFGNFQFQQPSVLATFNFKTFTIFNLGFFQAKFLNGSQQQQQQHINRILQSKKRPTLGLHYNDFGCNCSYCRAIVANEVVLNRGHNIVSKLSKRPAQHTEKPTMPRPQCSNIKSVYK